MVLALTSHCLGCGVSWWSIGATASESWGRASQRRILSTSFWCNLRFPGNEAQPAVNSHDGATAELATNSSLVPRWLGWWLVFAFDGIFLYDLRCVPILN